MHEFNYCEHATLDIISIPMDTATNMSARLEVLAISAQFVSPKKRVRLKTIAKAAIEAITPVERGNVVFISIVVATLPCSTELFIKQTNEK